MTAVNRFKDLDAWKKARVLTKEIYGLTRQVPLSKDYGLRDQIQGAAVSVMSNIAEGFGYKSDKQFAHFLNIARASAYEVQSLLFVALDASLIDSATFDQANICADEAIAKIAGLQRHLRTSPKVR